MSAAAGQEGGCVAAAGPPVFAKAAAFKLSEHPGDGVVAHADISASLVQTRSLAVAGFFLFQPGEEVALSGGQRHGVFSIKVFVQLRRLLWKRDKCQYLPLTGLSGGEGVFW